ncbi:hypothetical protein [Phenylobacterium sp.]|uniref:hypothetical protein n=1 Tax=Phenylobacterium sp. TaxID=1871053 RepID=UPI00271BC361|nr:hypothetical protein [Phenylobacterium sp.]MDO8377402.1 hypothetical protein [Phenylobacterium sp.]
MTKRWRITGYEGETVVFDRVLFGKVGHGQVQELLARLQSQHLKDSEIIDATLGITDSLKITKTLNGSDFSTSGHPRYYTADEEDV